MGADLYLESVSHANQARHKPSFDEWVQRRDDLLKAGKAEEARAAQLKVEEYYDKMYERGYFRDSYNGSNLLSLFDLDWWVNVSDLLDDEGMLSPTNAQAFLEMLTEQEPIFEARLPELITWEEWTKAEMEAYFRKKYKRLREFLEEAIRLNEAILCSI